LFVADRDRARRGVLPIEPVAIPDDEQGQAVKRAQILGPVLSANGATGVVQWPEPAAAVGNISCTSAAFAELSAEILGAGNALRFRARGTSMLPLVRDGDVLLVAPVHPAMVQIGDLVLCSSEGGRVVVHRVIRKEVSQEGRWFTVQGDAAARADGAIPEAQVYGRVAAIERGAANIDLDRPVMQMLGWLAALRSRWNLGCRPGFWLATRLVKRLPVFSRYLA
jgi:signal peptidase